MTVESPETPRKKQKTKHVTSQRTFFDIAIGGRDAGRIVCISLLLIFATFLELTEVL